MNRLALGTAQFGLDYGIANTRGRVELPEVRAILDRARRAGIDTVDTAILYGNSERQLGSAGLEGWRVVTKLPGLPKSAAHAAADWVVSETQASLERLGVDQLDALLLHRPAELLAPGGAAIYCGLERVKAQELVRKIGVSVYAPEDIAQLLGRYQFDLVQAPLSVIDRRLDETGWLDRLASDGVEVHVRSVFLQGLLLMSAGARPAWTTHWQPLWSAWDSWLTTHEQSAVETCLAYVLARPAVSRAVVGVDSVAQLEDLVRAAGRAAPSWPDTVACADLELINPSLWPRA